MISGHICFPKDPSLSDLFSSQGGKSCVMVVQALGPICVDSNPGLATF